MAASVEDLLIRIDATTENLRRELKKGDQQVADFDRKVNTSLSKIDDRFRTFGRVAQTAIGVVFGAGAVRSVFNFGQNVARTADNMALMQSRLTQLTGSNRAFDALKQSANKLGVSIEDASQSFGRFALAGQSIGLTLQETIKLNETIVQLGRIGGASAQEVAAGSLQLAQGLASGRLQGDELRSVLEQMPLVAKAIADGLGIDGVGALRKMGSEGRLTGDAVAGALLGAADRANEQFSRLPDQMEQFENRASNAFKTFQVELSATIGASETFQDIYQGIADTLLDAAGALKGFRGRDFIFGDELEASRTRVSLLTEKLEEMADASGRAATRMKAGIRAEIAGLQSKDAALQLDLVTGKIADLQEKLDSLGKTRARQAKEAGLQEALAELQDEANALGVVIEQHKKAEPVKKASKKATDEQSKSVETFIEKLRAESELIGKSGVDRQIAINLKKADTTATTALGQEIADLTRKIYEDEAAQKKRSEALEESRKRIDDVFEAHQKLIDQTSDFTKSYEQNIANTLALASAYRTGTKEAAILSETQKILGRDLNISAEEARDLAVRSVDASKHLEQMETSARFVGDSIEDAFCDLVGDFASILHNNPESENDRVFICFE